MTVDVKLNISDEVITHLQRAAQKRNVSLDEVVSEVLTDYFEEPTREELLAGLRQSLIDVATGNTQPADTLLAELKNELGDDADAG